MLGNRIGKQCRERWHNHLSPTVTKEAWSPEEDALIVLWHTRVGNRWAEIAKHLDGRCVRPERSGIGAWTLTPGLAGLRSDARPPCRTDNAVKNHWNSTMRRRLKGGSSSSATLASGSAGAAATPGQAQAVPDRSVRKSARAPRPKQRHGDEDYDYDQRPRTTSSPSMERAVPGTVQRATAAAVSTVAAGRRGRTDAHVSGGSQNDGSDNDVDEEEEDDDDDEEGDSDGSQTENADDDKENRDPQLHLPRAWRTRQGKKINLHCNEELFEDGPCRRRPRAHHLAGFA